MKYVVFSDIHGNCDALVNMLQHIHSLNDIGGYIFCGDIMGYFYEQKEVVDILVQQNTWYAVLGNHDVYYLDMLKNPISRNSLIKKYGKSYAVPYNNNLVKYLSGLKRRLDLCIDGKRLLIVHGTMDNPLEGRIYPDTEIDICTKYDYIFCGHTHYRMKRKIGNTWIINPGSLGQPRDGHGFSFCLVDFVKESCEFLNVSVDCSVLIKKMEFIGEERHLIDYIQNTFDRGGLYERA